MKIAFFFCCVLRTYSEMWLEWGLFTCLVSIAPFVDQMLMNRMEYTVRTNRLCPKFKYNTCSTSLTMKSSRSNVLPIAMPDPELDAWGSMWGESPDDVPASDAHMPKLPSHDNNHPNRTINSHGARLYISSVTAPEPTSAPPVSTTAKMVNLYPLPSSIPPS
jgi:hypothetical protein